MKTVRKIQEPSHGTDCIAICPSVPPGQETESNQRDKRNRQSHSAPHPDIDFIKSITVVSLGPSPNRLLTPCHTGAKRVCAIRP